MFELGAPNALALQSAPLNTLWSSESVALVTVANAPVRSVMKMIGAAPTDVVVAVGTTVPVKGSFPLRAKAKTWAELVLPGRALRISDPSRFASGFPKVGQTPELFEPYPRPARPSVPPPSFEFARQVANSASPGRMSVAAALTSRDPEVNRLETAGGGVESEELSPQRLEAIRLPGVGKVVMLTLQWG